MLNFQTPISLLSLTPTPRLSTTSKCSRRPRTNTLTPTCIKTKTNPEPPPTPARRPRPPTPGLPTTTSSISYLRDVSPLQLLSREEETALSTKVKIYCRLQRAYGRVQSKLKKGDKVEDDDWAGEAKITSVEELKKQWQEGVAARDELVERNLRLVLKIAREVWTSISYWNSREEVDVKSKGMGVPEEAIGIGFLDLVQEGNVGLIRAAEKFDPQKGSFGSYAYLHVKSFVQRATAPLGVLIKLPLGVKIAIWKIRKFRRVFYKEHGRYPTMSEEKIALPGKNIKKLREYESVVRRFVSLDGGDGDMRTEMEFLVSEKQEPQQWLDENFARNQLREEMKMFLTTRQEQVLTMRFGLDNDPPMKTLDIVKKTGLSYNQVTWIYKQAINVLRKNLDEASFAELLS